MSWIYLDIAALQNFKLSFLLHCAYGDHAPLRAISKFNRLYYNRQKAFTAGNKI